MTFFIKSHLFSNIENRVCFQTNRIDQAPSHDFPNVTMPAASSAAIPALMTQ